MPFCPECGAEYVEGVAECMDCRVALVAQPPSVPTDPELDPGETEAIADVPDAVTAMALKERLEDSGIAVWVRSFETSYYDGITKFIEGQGSWGRLWVLKEHADTAKALIDQWMAEVSEMTDEDAAQEMEDGSEL